MKNKTAVEWLEEPLLNILTHQQQMQLIGLFQQAKELEREQIINAYDAGTFYLEGGLYYKETFETETECDFNYYEIRSGKCENAKVVHGKIVCNLKGCN
jgi:hypothetical protein